MLLTTYRTGALAIAAVLCLLAAYALGRSDGADLVQGRWDKASLAAHKVLTEERDALAAQLATSNDKHLADLQKAQNENTALRARGSLVGLRIAANCPDHREVTADPGVDSRTGAELAADARQDYFALRDGIALAAAQLAACQDELKLRQ
jgi:prophage endopeptidase